MLKLRGLNVARWKYACDKLERQQRETIMAVISWKGLTLFRILGNMHYRK